jgi:predicted ATPase
LEESAKALDEALAWVDRTGEHMYEAEIFRLKGELALKQSVPESALAERCFEQALSIARRQHEKSWELRAATSLGRLWQRRNKRDDARRLLRPLYDWFSEGFETADLHDANALLNEID